MAGRAMRTALAVLPLALTLASMLAPEAEAGPGAVTLTGSLDGTADSTAISGQFTLTAAFRWNSDLIPENIPVASYPAILTLSIDNQTFVSAPDAGVFAVLYQPQAAGGDYEVEIQGSTGNIAEFFSTAAWVPASESVALSGLTEQSSGLPFGVTLVGGGSLDITALDSLGSTASIQVPEPAPAGLLAAAGALLAGVRRRRA